MLSLNGWKVFGIAWFANLIENIILLLFFGVSINLKTIIGAGVFALAVALIVDKIIMKGKW